MVSGGEVEVRNRGVRGDGDPTTVIGLPLRTTLDLLVTAGVSWPSAL